MTASSWLSTLPHTVNSLNSTYSLMANPMNCNDINNINPYAYSYRRESKTAVRLRRNTEQNGTVEYVLTVKSRLKIENGISIASESEQLVSESTALLLLSDPSAVFANIDTLCTHHIQLEYTI